MNMNFNVYSLSVIDQNRVQHGLLLLQLPPSQHKDGVLSLGQPEQEARRRDGRHPQPISADRVILRSQEICRKRLCLHHLRYTHCRTRRPTQTQHPGSWAWCINLLTVWSRRVCLIVLRIWLIQFQQSVLELHTPPPLETCRPAVVWHWERSSLCRITMWLLTLSLTFRNPKLISRFTRQH